MDLHVSLIDGRRLTVVDWGKPRENEIEEKEIGKTERESEREGGLVLARSRGPHSFEAYFSKFFISTPTFQLFPQLSAQKKNSNLV